MGNKPRLIISNVKISKAFGGEELFSKIITEELSNTFEVTYVGRPFDINCSNKVYPFTNFLDKFPIKKGLGKLMKKFPFLTRLFIKNLALDCDVLISNSNYDDLFIGKHAKYLAAIFIKHDPYEKYNGKYPDSLIGGRKYLIFALNYEDRDLLEKKYGNNVKILKIGIKSSKDKKSLPPKDFDFYKDKSIIFSIGRLNEKQKRFSLGIESFGILTKKYKNLIYVIAGTGPDLDNYIKLAKNLGIPENVRFLGFIQDEEKNWFLRNSKVVLQTSEKENQSAVIIEALKNGGIILSTKNASSEFLIKDKFNGFLTSSKKEDISKSLENILKLDKKNLEIISRNAIASVKDFTTDKMIAEISESIKSLLS
ncbi:MAG: glycosyltransferase [Candidatus Parvarchaeota archaeon]|nr:glycosyltransferase [Candidatus Parvarchaeum tengchongense]MCW1295719.1 glycosyltransferase [Candidatus Parvarchaeum tengchongense]